MFIRKIKGAGRLLRRIWRALGLIPPYARWVGFRGAAQLALAPLVSEEKPVRVTLCGHKIWVRAGTRDLGVAVHCLGEHQYESIECRAPKVIIDAGANIGAVSVFFARRYPQARILAIEPERRNYEMLVRNVKDWPRVVPVQAALWGSRAVMPLVNPHRGHWSYTITETKGRQELLGQDTECLPLDDLMARHGITDIDLLKMDIEGAEIEVLAASDSWIGHVGVLCVELHEENRPGCRAVFERATRNFTRFESTFDHVIAYR